MLASTKLHLEQLENRNLPAPIAYHGGPVLEHVKVEALFYGSFWDTSAGTKREAALKNAISSLIGGSYMDKLVSLTGGPAVGRGSLDKVDVDPVVKVPPSVFTQVQSIIKGEVANHHLPSPGPQTCYLFIGPPGVDVGPEGHFQMTVNKVPAAYVRLAYLGTSTDNDGVPVTSLQSETWGLTRHIIDAATDPFFNGYHFRNGDALANRANSLAKYPYYSNFKTSTGTYAVSPYWLALPPYGADAYFASLVTAPKKHEMLGDFAELEND